MYPSAGCAEEQRQAQSRIEDLVNRCCVGGVMVVLLVAVDLILVPEVVDFLVVLLMVVDLMLVASSSGLI